MLRRLKIWQKLTVVVVVMGLPIAALIYLYLTARAVQVDFAQKEILGVEYLKPVRHLAEHLPLHRGLVHAVQRGIPAQKAEALRVGGVIDSDLTAIEEVDQRLGGTMKTTEHFRSIRRNWADLKEKALTLSAAESFSQHSRLIADVAELIRINCDQSNLILDPNLDTYYLVDSVCVQLPQTVEDLEFVRGVGTGIAAQRKITAEEVVQLTARSQTLQDRIKGIRRGLHAAYEYNRSLETAVAPSAAAAFSGAEDFLQASGERLLRASAVTIEPRQYFDSGAAAVGGVLGYYDAALANLRGLLAGRILRLNREKRLQLGVVLAVVALAGLLVLVINRGITRQIGSLGSVLAQIGIGDFAARAQVSSGDELGTVARSLNSMLDSTLTLIQSREERDRIEMSIRKLLDEMTALAEGDLTKEAEVTTEITGAVADSLNFMIGELRRIISAVQVTTLQVTSSANEVQATTEHLAQGSEMQTAQIVDTTAAIDEMAVSIQQVSENAVTAAAVADQAMKNARRGAESVTKTIRGMDNIRTQVQETSKRIKRLGESSQEIGEIVQLIRDIADRTSILALNASIQAAMAGDAGRGFAVVAEEVERLAERSTEATKRIGTLTKSIQSDTSEAVTAMEGTTREVVVGSELANEAGQALVEIEAVSNRLAELIQSISMASKQQARVSESVAHSMGDISEITQRTASGAKQAAVSIRGLAELADQLRNSLDRFKLPVEVA